VYNRNEGSERPLGRKRGTDALVDVLWCAVQRDGLTFFAWCLPSNHRQLAVRTEYASVWKRRHKHKGVPGTFWAPFEEQVC
jgi:hypothetical protein